MFRSVVSTIVIVALLGSAGYFAYDRLAPCRHPILFSVGTIDERFGVSQEKFEAAVSAATELWNAAVGRPLFSSVANGGLRVQAVFDHRQEADGMMKNLEKKLENGQESYEQMVARYDAQKSAYDAQSATYEKAVDEYEAKKSAYETKVDEAEAAPSITPSAFRTLERERNALNAEAERLEKEYTTLQTKHKDLQSFTTVINRLALEHNESVDAYRTIGEGLGDEFEAGVYERRGGNQQITIYAFSDDKELQNLLAHELGHALGLQHLEDPTAIMYRLNESDNQALSVADIAAIRSRCGIEE